MRRRVEAAVRRVWRGEGGGVTRVLAGLAWPLQLVYRSGVALRNAAYDRGLARSARPSVPAISVGNLVVGGSGKTPVAAWLARHLADAGLGPALVARGYGQDELALHAAWNPDVPVHAGADRVAAVERAAAGGARCAVLDDAFQHRRLSRDLDVVVVAAEQPFPAPLLPRGPYREPLSALDRADVVVVTRKDASDREADERAADVRRRAPHLLVARVDLVPAGWRDLEGRDASPPDADALAVTGVAAPEGFSALVRGLTGAEPELMAFPDHHPYDAGDADRILRAAGPRTVVTTEKDAVKLAELSRMLPPVRVLRLEVRGGEGADALLARARSVASGPAAAGPETGDAGMTAPGGEGADR